jgi:hypothetical protein
MPIFPVRASGIMATSEETTGSRTKDKVKAFSRVERGDFDMIIPLKKFEQLMLWIPQCQSRFQLETMAKLLNPE